MIKIENAEVVGWEAAIRGMRNPMNSWEKSDSGWCFGPACPDDALLNKCKDECPYYKKEDCESSQWVPYVVGKNDLDLMTRLRNAGMDHRKFMRMITVYLDITAPLYWWKEFDTYKVGTVANSCSTMHKIADKEFTLDDFSTEHLIDGVVAIKNPNGIDEHSKIATNPLNVLRGVIDSLNTCREAYLNGVDRGGKFMTKKDKDIWWQMIQLLPSSYNQRRTVMLNYEVLANIYKSRYNHKLDEWHDFCSWIEGLVYSSLITAMFDGDIYRLTDYHKDGGAGKPTTLTVGFRCVTGITKNFKENGDE